MQLELNTERARRDIDWANLRGNLLFVAKIKERMEVALITERDQEADLWIYQGKGGGGETVDFEIEQAA
jgi:hypothetical protein